MIKTIFTIIAAVCLIASTQAFAPQLPVTHTFGKVASKTQANLFSGDEERTAITRDTEPEDFFVT